MLPFLLPPAPPPLGNYHHHHHHRRHATDLREVDERDLPVLADQQVELVEVAVDEPRVCQADQQVAAVREHALQKQKEQNIIIINNHNNNTRLRQYVNTHCSRSRSGVSVIITSSSTPPPPRLGSRQGRTPSSLTCGSAMLPCRTWNMGKPSTLDMSTTCLTTMTTGHTDREGGGRQARE